MSRHRALCAATALALLTATSPAVAAGWSRAYVIEAFEPAFYFGAAEGDATPGTDCPSGAVDELDWRKALKTVWRTDADVAKILDPENPQRPTNGGYRGPAPDINVYAQPWTVPDDGIAEVTGTIAYGFNLDGDESTGFTSPDGKIRGVDNEYYRTTGCLMAWRGPARLGHHQKYVIDGMRDGQFTMVMVVSGSGSDPDNDPDARVGFYTSRDKMVKDANGGIASDFTFAINNAANAVQSVVKARTVNGVIETQAPSDISTRNIDRAPLQLKKAQMRFEKAPHGGLVGIIGGYRSIDDYYVDWQTGGAIFELTMHINTPAFWYALHRNADGFPNEFAENTMISTAYRYYAVPAFVVSPDARTQVTEAKLFPTEEPAPTRTANASPQAGAPR